MKNRTLQNDYDRQSITGVMNSANKCKSSSPSSSFLADQNRAALLLFHKCKEIEILCECAGLYIPKHNKPLANLGDIDSVLVAKSRC